MALTGGRGISTGQDGFVRNLTDLAQRLQNFGGEADTYILNPFSHLLGATATVSSAAPTTGSLRICPFISPPFRLTIDYARDATTSAASAIVNAALYSLQTSANGYAWKMLPGSQVQFQNPAGSTTYTVALSASVTLEPGTLYALGTQATAAGVGTMVVATTTSTFSGEIRAITATSLLPSIELTTLTASSGLTHPLVVYLTRKAVERWP